MRHLTWLALLLSIGVRPAAAQTEPAQAPALAGQAAAWTPQECGPEPTRPVLDLGSREKYNHAADVVNEYEGKAKAWDACVMKQANADMEAISASAKTRMAAISRDATQIQSQVYAGFAEYTTQFKAAQERFEKEK